MRQVSGADGPIPLFRMKKPLEPNQLQMDYRFMAHSNIVSDPILASGAAAFRVFRVTWCDVRKMFVALTDQGELLAHSADRSEVAEIALREATAASGQGAMVAVRLEPCALSSL